MKLETIEEMRETLEKELTDDMYRIDVTKSQYIDFLINEETRVRKNKAQLDKEMQEYLRTSGQQ